MKLLVGHSGGFDSTYLLWLLLRATTHEITAIYFNFANAVNHSGRDYTTKTELELRAVATTRELLKKHCRPFDEIECHVAEIAPGEWVTPTITRLAGNICRRQGFDGYAAGRTLENMSANRGALMTDRYKKLFADHAGPGIQILWPLLDHRVGRPHALAELPAEIAAAVQYCDGAKLVAGRVIPCGDCIKCRNVKATRAGLAAGIRTASDLFDDLLRSKGAGPYAGVTPDDAYRVPDLPADAKFLES